MLQGSVILMGAAEGERAGSPVHPHLDRRCKGGDVERGTRRDRGLVCLRQGTCLDKGPGRARLVSHSMA